MPHPTQLNQLGWSSQLERVFQEYREEGAEVGRVAVLHKTQYLLCTTFGEMSAKLLYLETRQEQRAQLE